VEIRANNDPMTKQAARWREGGQVTAFVVTLAAALILMAGLVLDGGLVLAAKRRAINEAEAAARAGAQQVAVDVYRSTGRFVLDPSRAREAALAYLATTGDPGSVSVAADRVSVTVRITQSMQILSVAGLGPATVTGRGVATAERGVRQAEP
jgi:Putative Flp pilus-assembly TadE/G-like